MKVFSKRNLGSYKHYLANLFGLKSASISCAGNSRWVHSMEWSGQQGFNSSEEISFSVDGKEAGVLKSYGALNFLKVLSEKPRPKNIVDGFFPVP